MQSLIYVWISFLIGLFWASGCLGQAPALALEPFSGGCPSSGSIVQVEGTVNMEGVPDTSKYTGIDLVDSSGGIIASKSFSKCSQESSLSCKEINSTYYTVVYKAPTNQAKSGDNVKLQTYHDDTLVFTDSNSVPYPIVKDEIKEAFKINNANKSLDGNKVRHPTTGSFTVSYSVTGVSLSNLTFSILDSPNGKELTSKPASGSEMSMNITAKVTNCIYVTYTTTNGCSEGTTVCFTGDGGGGDSVLIIIIVVSTTTGCSGGVILIVVIYFRKRKITIKCSPGDRFHVVLRTLQVDFEKDLLRKVFSFKIRACIKNDNKITFHWKDPNLGGKLLEVPPTSNVGDVAELLGLRVDGECVEVVMKPVRKGENVEITVVEITGNPPHPKDIAMKTRSSKTDAESGGCGDAIDGSPSNNTDTTSKPEK